MISFQKIGILFLGLALISPGLVFSACVPGSNAAPSGPPTDFEDFVCYAINLIDLIIPVVTTLAFLVFFWGIIVFIRAGGDEKKIESGKQLLFWGSIALFVIISFWGILQVLSNSLFGSDPIGFPLLPTNTP